MNDFTKEELEFVFQFMIQCGSRGNLSKYNDVLVKLKSLIDNYCEHEKATTIHPGDTVLICNNCETILSAWNLRKANSANYS